jgi:serine phosphatase RsbU (regulator of sigma subunit)
MDCVLCKFDFNSLTLTFAAANSPLWLVRKGDFTEYKLDKMPVGKYTEDDKEFSQQTIQLQKGDTIYTFTDGYIDQFGGPNGKKFKHKQFEKLLLSVQHLPMKEQQNILEITINRWKDKLEQVDDILVIGIKI